ncbi:ATP-binding protein [Streptomyces sp. NPDC017941]|uniref:ATP-binding protein n=1 Tax=Streptomyces sp. NPDC017941 TaxID=3365018 RepID=UPI00379FD770
MKQSAAKTLGVAALGAAFAATGAGAAQAASAVPDAAGTVAAVTSAAPVGELAETLPDGAPESIAAGRSALGTSLTAVQPTIDQMVPLPDDEGGHGGTAGKAVKGTKPAPQPAANPVSGLLGGLPVQQVLANNALPTGGLPLKALPTQALLAQGLPTGALGATPLL